MKTETKYKTVWELIDKIDRQHAEQNSEWQVRELKTVIDSLNKFHFSVKSESIYHIRISNMIKKFEEKNDFDFMFIDRLKDAVHNIWLEIEGQDELGKPERNRHPLTDLKEQFSDENDIEFFNKFRFRDLYYGHSKEGKDREYDEQVNFLHNFFRLYDKENNTELADAFGFMIHDREQEISNLRFYSEHLQDIHKAYTKKLITQKCFLYLLKLGHEIIKLTVEQGDWTNHVDKLKNKFNPSYYLIHDMLDDDFDWTVECKGSINCRVRIKLSQKEIKDFKNGLGLEEKICVGHSEYDGHGDRHANKTLDYWFFRLPKCPVVIRIVGIDESWNRDRKMVDRINQFIKKHEGIEIHKVREESFVDDEGSKMSKYKVHYIKFTNDKTLFDFTKHFIDDFVYGFKPEIERRKI